MANEMKLFEVGDRFNRLNQNSGIYQARASAQKILKESRKKAKGEYKGIILFTQTIMLPQQSFSPTNAGTSYDLDGISRQYYRVYYRIPELHRDIPLPPAFRKDVIIDHFRKTEFEGRTEAGRIGEDTRREFGTSRITPSYLHRSSEIKEAHANDLWISVHPYVTYPVDASDEKLGPGDVVQISIPDAFAATIPDPSIPFKLLRKAPVGINWKKSLDKNIKKISDIFEDESDVVTSLRDADYFKFNPDAFPDPGSEDARSLCYGALDGVLKKQATACGFKDPRVLLAIRQKEVGSDGDDRKIRFEANQFISTSANSRLKIPALVNAAWLGTLGYKKIKLNGKSTFLPKDAEYDPNSEKTFIEQVLPDLHNPEGAVNQGGGIYYIPNPEFVDGEIKSNADKIYEWGPKYKAYNNSHIGDAAFMKAFEVDPTRAILSTSFGRYQVMGWALLQLAGGDAEKALKMYLDNPVETAASMFAIWCKQPRNNAAIQSLNAASTRNDTTPTLDEWLAWALVYNGPLCCGDPASVTADGYHVRMSEAYKKTKGKCPKISDVQVTANGTPVPFTL